MVDDLFIDTSDDRWKDTASDKWAMTYGKLKRWTGTAWVKEPLQTYLAGSWQTKPLKRWDGSSWLLVDITG